LKYETDIKQLQTSLDEEKERVSEFEALLKETEQALSD